MLNVALKSFFNSFDARGKVKVNRARADIKCHRGNHSPIQWGVLIKAPELAPQAIDAFVVMDTPFTAVQTSTAVTSNFSVRSGPPGSCSQSFIVAIDSASRGYSGLFNADQQAASAGTQSSASKVTERQAVFRPLTTRPGIDYPLCVYRQNCTSLINRQQLFRLGESVETGMVMVSFFDSNE
ncbi:hypothetical protein [Rhizobium laguerreae]|uniref:hypothetical protein n=1 Tax=Rhizobium laguerreae TaxID=1076926 RepID=UPI001C8FD26E|nr:hypothetical protein [Rhizobium laguerreae]MBY3389182.1 hypothetical protein [Rhizobium laguerreae]MBY3402933.1 hypothetical protein [Rhizobium laguerreae]MBY3409872.1 hypothetical protein [Rhizobium laguerreae]